MKKIAIKMLRIVVAPYILLVLFLFLSFGIAGEIAKEGIDRIYRPYVFIDFQSAKIVKSVAALLLTLILGIGAIKFIDRYNQEK